MWKQIFDLARQLLLLTESTQKNRADLTALQKELKDFSAKTESEIRALRSAIERLAYELQRTNDAVRHSQEREASEREKFMLKVENRLLKAGRQLPPVSENESEK